MLFFNIVIAFLENTLLIPFWILESENFFLWFFGIKRVKTIGFKLTISL